MSEQEAPIVEAVEESESILDAAPEAPSNPDGAEADASVELNTVSSATENGSSPDSDEAASSIESAPSMSTEEANDGGEAASTDSITNTEAADADNVTAEASTSEAASAEATDAKASTNKKSSKKGRSDRGGKKIVRTLAVGQEMTGTVKRLTDFGAFVDLGVGRDGLLHVSELSVQRVNKVSDVLSQGQEVTVWIKELNREKNRISLTLISPDTKTIRDINKDDILEGTVTRMTNFGAFIDIGIGRDALLHVREMAEGFVKRPEDVVSIGETLEVRIVELNRRRGRVDLSIKGLRPEPESEDGAADGGFADSDEEFVDEFENVEPMSAMELALKRAMEANGGDGGRSKRSRRKEKRNRSEEDEMNEIISRTLSGS